MGEDKSVTSASSQTEPATSQDTALPESSPSSNNGNETGIASSDDDLGGEVEQTQPGRHSTEEALEMFRRFQQQNMNHSADVPEEVPDTVPEKSTGDSSQPQASVHEEPETTLDIPRSPELTPGSASLQHHPTVIAPPSIRNRWLQTPTRHASADLSCDLLGLETQDTIPPSDVCVLLMVDEKWIPHLVPISAWTEKKATTVKAPGGWSRSLPLDHGSVFDLNLGDVVKVDRPKYRRYSWEVRTGHNLGTSGFRTAQGFSHFVLAQRPDSKETITASVAEIYLNIPLHRKWLERHDPETLKPGPSPPHKRHRRGLAEPKTYTDDLSDVDESLERSSNTFELENSHGIFQGCLFSLTMIDDNNLESLIEKNGGRILSFGLSDIVSDDLASYDFGGAKFIACLAPRPTKTPKFVEMSACAWPCLKKSFIYESVQAQRFMDWRRFVLPSTTDVNSDVTYFWQKWYEDWDLNDQFRTRTKVLDMGVPVYIVRPTVNTPDDMSSRLLFIARLVFPHLIESRSQASIPIGSFIIDLSKREGSPDLLTARSLASQIGLRDSCIVGYDWLVASVMSRQIASDLKLL